MIDHSPHQLIDHYHPILSHTLAIVVFSDGVDSSCLVTDSSLQPRSYYWSAQISSYDGCTLVASHCHTSVYTYAPELFYIHGLWPATARGVSLTSQCRSTVIEDQKIDIMVPCCYLFPPHIIICYNEEYAYNFNFFMLCIVARGQEIRRNPRKLFGLI